MSNVYDLHDSGSSSKQAAVWISRLDRGLSKNEVKELREWLNEPRHKQEFLALAGTWDKLDSLSQLSTLCTPDYAGKNYPPVI